MNKLQIETIGANEAAKILSRVHSRQVGRNIKSAIDAYAKAMRDGSWDENVSAPIIISDKGELMDGWHRLHAVIKANAVVNFVVVRGVPSESFSKIDSGKPRSPAFRNGMAADTMAIINLFYQIRRNSFNNPFPQPEEVEELHAVLSVPLALWARLATKVKKSIITSAPVRAGVMLRMIEFPEHAESFVHLYNEFISGNLSNVPPVISVLYKKLIQARTARGTATWNNLLATWNAFNPAGRERTRMANLDVQLSLEKIRVTVLSPVMDVTDD